MTLVRQREGLLIRRVTRHSWGPDPARVVVVATISRDGEHFTRVIGAEDGRAVELERRQGGEVRHVPRPSRVVFDDGTEWVLGGVGCSCNVPGPLKGLDPLRMP